MRNIEKTAQTGREYIHEHQTQDLTTSEMYEIVDKYTKQSREEGHDNALLSTIYTAFLMGIGTGTAKTRT